MEGGLGAPVDRLRRVNTPTALLRADARSPTSPTRRPSWPWPAKTAARPAPSKMSKTVMQDPRCRSSKLRMSRFDRSSNDSNPVGDSFYDVQDHLLTISLSTAHQKAPEKRSPGDYLAALSPLTSEHGMPSSLLTSAFHIATSGVLSPAQAVTLLKDARPRELGSVQVELVVRAVGRLGAAWTTKGKISKSKGVDFKVQVGDARLISGLKDQLANSGIPYRLSA